MKTFLVILAIAICFSAYAAIDSRSGAWTAETFKQANKYRNKSAKSRRFCRRKVGAQIPHPAPALSRVLQAAGALAHGACRLDEIFR